MLQKNLKKVHENFIALLKKTVEVTRYQAPIAKNTNLKKTLN